MTAFQPKWASPPGHTLRKVLRSRNITQSALSERLGEDRAFVSDLLSGDIPVTVSLARQLQEILSISSEFIIAREEQYRNDLLHLKDAEEQQSRNSFVSELPYNHMAKMGWVPATMSPKERFSNAMQFFCTDGIDDWKTKYKNLRAVTAFRESYSIKSNELSVISWLRQGERLAHDIDCLPWNKEAFSESLNDLRFLTRESDPEKLISSIQSHCAKFGVAVVFVQTPPQCPSSGATRFLSEDKAVIQLSFRYKSDDHFWFTFFHEAGHLILHDKNAIFLEDNSESTQSEEDEANLFSQNFLLPHEYLNYLKEISFARNDLNRARRIYRLARKANISPGIVVGQMQHKGLLRFDQLNRLKIRYNLRGVM